MKWKCSEFIIKMKHFTLCAGRWPMADPISAAIQTQNKMIQQQSTNALSIDWWTDYKRSARRAAIKPLWLLPCGSDYYVQLRAAARSGWSNAHHRTKKQYITTIFGRESLKWTCTEKHCRYPSPISGISRKNAINNSVKASARGSCLKFVRFCAHFSFSILFAANNNCSFQTFVSLSRYDVVVLAQWLALYAQLPVQRV